MLHTRFGYLIFPAIGMLIVGVIAFAAGYVRGHDSEQDIALGVPPGAAFESPAALTGVVQEVGPSEIVINVNDELYRMALADDLVVEVVASGEATELAAGQWVSLETNPDWKVNAVVTAVLVYAEDIVADGTP